MVGMRVCGRLGNAGSLIGRLAQDLPKYPLPTCDLSFLTERNFVGI